MNIITGTTGQAHITPTQDAMWHRGMQGKASGIFNVGMKFAPIKVNNNTVRVQDGCLSIQGRFACIDPATYDDVLIQNGAQGKNRIDIICARLTIDRTQNPPTSIADLYVFQGDESSSVPEVPVVPETDLDNADIVAYLPIVKVQLNGLEITNLSMIAQTFNLGGIFDSELSDTSENAPQTKIVKAAVAPLDNLNSSSEMVLRQSKLVAEESAPSSDGQICWMFE